jgi:hypothetical protein
MKLHYMESPTDTEYHTLIADAKRLPFPVNIRRHTDIVRWHNAIDLRPHKSQAYHFTPTQVDTVIALLRQHHLTHTMSELWDSPNRAYIYATGFNYLMKDC